MPTTILDNESYLEALQRRYVEESKNEENMKLIQMAEEACSLNQTLNTDLEFLKRFADLVAVHEKKFWMEQIEVECNEAALAERELCAKLFADEDCLFEGKHIAAAIRARSEK